MFENFSHTIQQKQVSASIDSRERRAYTCSMRSIYMCLLHSFYFLLTRSDMLMSCGPFSQDIKISLKQHFFVFVGGAGIIRGGPQPFLLAVIDFNIFCVKSAFLFFFKDVCNHSKVYSTTKKKKRHHQAINQSHTAKRLTDCLVVTAGLFTVV